MKLNLLLSNDKDLRSGHINIDPLAPPEDDRRTRADWTNLDDICCVAEAESIVAMEILGVIPRVQARQVLGHWISRLRHGGELALSVVDTVAVSRALIRGELSLPDAGVLLYGEQKQTHQLYKSEWSLSVLVELLKSAGLEIIKQRVQNYRAVVVARRP